MGEPPPPSPRACFGRDGLIERVVRLVENLEPVALIGAGGIGKTSIALTVLHHDRVKERFGDNRRFIRCDQFPASRPHFLARLSKSIGAGIENPKDLLPLRSFLSSKEILIILDNTESILDPQGTNAQEIYAAVDELCQFKTICLCITSRITTVPSHCKRPEIPTLSMGAACDIFYNIYNNSGRSRIVNDLLHRLDFHALSITLLATTASHNTWDYNQLVQEWNTQRAQVLRTDYNESLAATIELSLTSPTFEKLSPNARNLLGVIAFFPQGINRENLEWLFPTIPDRKHISDKFCLLSLTHRSNGFITMLAPIREYLLPKDPKSSPLLCAAKSHYFARLSVDVNPGNPGFEEAQWIMSEDVNVEHLLNVFTSIDNTSPDVWNACVCFIQHLYWHKPRQTLLGPKIEGLPDNHHFKPRCLSELSWLCQPVGNPTEQKRLLTHTLKLERERGDRPVVAQTLRYLSDANRLLGLYEEGIQQAGEALEVHQQLSDVTEQAICLNTLAWSLLANKQPDAAENAASHAIKLVPEEGQEFTICQSHRLLGEVYHSKGKREGAIHHFKTALRIASPFNWHEELSWIHYSLAKLFFHEGKFKGANTHIKGAKSHAVENVYCLGRIMEMQAEIWYKQCKPGDARSEALGALEVYEKLGAVRDVEDCRALLWKIEQEMEN
jgi:tetratricopeptide (TPR) repeat protein